MANIFKTRFPGVHILALGTDGSRVRLERQENQAADLVNLSLTDLLGMLRRGYPNRTG